MLRIAKGLEAEARNATDHMVNHGLDEYSFSHGNVKYVVAREIDDNRGRYLATFVIGDGKEVHLYLPPGEMSDPAVEEVAE